MERMRSPRRGGKAEIGRELRTSQSLAGNGTNIWEVGRNEGDRRSHQRGRRNHRELHLGSQGGKSVFRRRSTMVAIAGDIRPTAW